MNDAYLILFFSVLLGGGASWFIKTDSLAFRLSLAFSGAFLFGTLMLHLLPELFEGNAHSIGVWVLLGFGVQLFLDFISKGLEHGHYHAHGNKLPLLPLLGLFIHSFIEGMPLAEHATHDHAHNGPGLLWSLVLHKMPIALLVTSALRNAKISTPLVITSLVLFALSTPLGSLAAGTLTAYTLPILGLATGLLLHVSTTILFESSANHQFNAYKLLAVGTGIGLSLLLLL